MVEWHKARSRAMAMDAITHALEDMRGHRGHLFGNVATGVVWCAMLDEDLRNDIGRSYEALRDNQAPFIHGLLHARNGVMHAALVVVNEGGITAPLTVPLVVPPPSWRASAVLHTEWEPKDRDKPRVQHRVAMYDEHLAGKTPADTLQAARDFFERLRDAGWDPQAYGLE